MILVQECTAAPCSPSSRRAAELLRPCIIEPCFRHFGSWAEPCAREGLIVPLLLLEGGRTQLGPLARPNAIGRPGCLGPILLAHIHGAS